MRTSRTTAWKWWRRFHQAGVAVLFDWPSVVGNYTHRARACEGAPVLIARKSGKRFSIKLALQIRLPASTVVRVLAGQGASASRC